MKKMMLRTAAFLAAISAMAAELQYGTVTAKALNVRMKPELNSVAVTRLHEGDAVEITGTHGEFLELAASKLDVPVYVSAVYIHGGKTFQPLTMRSDMAPEAPSYGNLPKGSEVKVTRLVAHTGWAQIVPPESLRVYAASKYIRIGAKPEAPAVAAEAKPEKKVEAKAAEKAESRPDVSAAKNVTKPSEPKAGKKVEKKVEKKVAEPVSREIVLPEKYRKAFQELNIDPAKHVPALVKGIVTEVPDTKNPAVSYALVRKGKSGYDTIYFLFSDHKNVDLKKSLNSTVLVKGDSYKVPNWKTPVLRVEKISVVE